MRLGNSSIALKTVGFDRSSGTKVTYSSQGLSIRFTDLHQRHRPSRDIHVYDPWVRRRFEILPSLLEHAIRAQLACASAHSRGLCRSISFFMPEEVLASLSVFPESLKSCLRVKVTRLPEASPKA